MTPFEEGVYVLRGFERGDRDFVVSSWVRSHFGSRFARTAGNQYYRVHHIPRIERAVDDPGRSIVCAVLVEDPRVIVGWSTGSKRLLDYVYVKSSARQMGVGQTLMAVFEPAARSHETLITNDFFKKRGIAYDPYAFR